MNCLSKKIGQTGRKTGTQSYGPKAFKLWLPGCLYNELMDY